MKSDRFEFSGVDLVLAGVTLGESRAEVLKRLGEPEQSFEHGPPSWYDAKTMHPVINTPSLSDAWGDRQVKYRSYDDEWRVTYVEVAAPTHVEVNGVQVNGMPLVDVEQLLTATGLVVERHETDSAAARVDGWGIGFYLDDDVIMATSLGA